MNNTTKANNTDQSTENIKTALDLMIAELIKEQGKRKALEAKCEQAVADLAKALQDSEITSHELDKAHGRTTALGAKCRLLEGDLAEAQEDIKTEAYLKFEVEQDLETARQEIDRLKAEKAQLINTYIKRK